ncbi:MAG: chemotaxis protein, partial [Rhodospirillaceae bacterium]|nr:chemotaxis protein [Rhodospirillaceae bacterium]
MMNLSSLSKTKAAIIASATFAIIAEVGAIMGIGGIIEEIAIGLIVLAAIASFLLINKVNKQLRRTVEVCQAASKGEFEARILNITEGGDLGAMQHAVNALVDISDAYVRETIACQEYVVDNKYFRKILPAGMRGTFLNAAVIFNKASDTIAAKTSSFNAVADDFEKNMKVVVESVSAAATEMQSTAKSMEGTAQSTQQQSTIVAAAAEEASTNVQTVASAAEELSSSISEISRQVAQSTQIAGA